MLSLQKNDPLKNLFFLMPCSSPYSLTYIPDCLFSGILRNISSFQCLNSENSWTETQFSHRKQTHKSTQKSCAFIHPYPQLAFKSSSCTFTTYHLKAHLSRKHLIKTTQTVLWGRWSLSMHVDARSNTQFLLSKCALRARAEMDTGKITELAEARTATSCKTTAIRVKDRVLS